MLHFSELNYRLFRACHTIYSLFTAAALVALYVFFAVNFDRMFGQSYNFGLMMLGIGALMFMFLVTVYFTTRIFLTQLYRTRASIKDINAVIKARLSDETNVLRLSDDRGAFVCVELQSPDVFLVNIWQADNKHYILVVRETSVEGIRMNGEYLYLEMIDGVTKFINNGRQMTPVGI